MGIEHPHACATRTTTDPADFRELSHIEVIQMARTPTIETTIDGATLRLAFDNGEVIELFSGALSPEIRAAALMHGLKQKLVDAAAISRNPDTGRSATTADKYNAVRDVYERLLAGEWNKTREGGAGSGGGLLLRALVRLNPAKDPAKLRDYVAGKSAEEQSALRKHGPIAAMIAQIKAEDAARKPGEGGGEGKPDAGAMLDELAGL